MDDSGPYHNNDVLTVSPDDNLSRALAALGPAAAPDLHDPACDSRLVHTPRGPALKVVQSVVQIQTTDAWCQGTLAQEPPVGRLVIAGAGDGRLLQAALAAWPTTRIVLWDADAAVLRHVLREVPLAAPIESGRLCVVHGVQILELGLGEDDRVVPHPVLGPRYRRQLAAASGAQGPRVVVGDGQLMAADLADSLAAEGWVPWPLSLDGGDPGALARLVSALDAKLVAVINHIHGLPELCESLGVPLMVWEIDPAMDRPRSPTTTLHHTHIFTWRQSHEAEFRRVGFPAVHYLPLAAPSRRKRLQLTANETAEFAAPVSFVGESMATRARPAALQAVQAVAAWLRQRGRPPTEAPQLVQGVLDTQRQDLDQWAIPGVLRTRLPGLDAQGGSRVSMLLGEVVAAERRLTRVAALAPLGVHVWGDTGWQALASRGVRVRGRAGHFHALTRIYNATAINIDIGRLYQRDIVTMRVFDVLACGGFVLADHSEALCALLRPGVEVETWRTVGELVDKARWYLKHPDKAAAIAQRGHDAVHRDHSIRARVRQMLAVMDLSAATLPDPPLPSGG